jgi:hypothetical protein
MGDVPQNNGLLDTIGDNIKNVVENTTDIIKNNKIVNNTNSLLSNTASSISNNISSTSVQNTKNAIMETLIDNTSVLFLMIALLVVASIVGYIIYFIIADSVLYQQKLLIPGSDVPLICNTLQELKFKQKLESGNGIKRTYCFWIYIFDINTGGGKYRHVARISNNKNKNDIKKCSPLIILDKNKNSLHIRFPFLNDEDENAISTVNISNVEPEFYSYNNVASGFTIDYIPIQRWVHVAFVVSDLAGGSITSYVDGSFNKNHTFKTGGIFAPLELSKLNFDCEGSLFVGENNSSESGLIGFSGLLSKFTIFNYELNKNDIYKEYRSGPINGILASLGIGAYGIRNPIYKLNANSSNN